MIFVVFAQRNGGFGLIQVKSCDQGAAPFSEVEPSAHPVRSRHEVVTENGDFGSTHVSNQLLQRCHFLSVVICAEFDLLDRQVTFDNGEPQPLGFRLFLY